MPLEYLSQIQDSGSGMGTTAIPQVVADDSGIRVQRNSVYVDDALKMHERYAAQGIHGVLVKSRNQDAPQAMHWDDLSRLRSKFTGRNPELEIVDYWRPGGSYRTDFLPTALHREKRQYTDMVVNSFRAR